MLYPTAGLTFGLVRDRDWACALASGYNDYLYETFTRPEKRLKGMALIPLQSIPAAVNELKRAVNELGFVGAVLPAVGLLGGLVILIALKTVARDMERVGAGVGVGGPP